MNPRIRGGGGEKKTSNKKEWFNNHYNIIIHLDKWDRVELLLMIDSMVMMIVIEL